MAFPCLHGLRGAGLACLTLSTLLYSCTDDPEWAPSAVEGKVTWEFGAVGGGDGLGGNGLGGDGGAGQQSEIVGLDRFNAAVDAFTQFVGDCGTFVPGSYSFGRYASTPYRTHVLECIVETRACATQKEYLCNYFPEEWVDCLEQFEKFTCEDGESIAGNLQCDTIADCSDSSDERDCQELWRRCADGTPVLHSQWCNATRDCPDASDERDCSFDYFVCDNQRGIPGWRVCDGVQDCVDGSDEDQECARVSCN